jgi:hypothetical protein
LPFAVAVKLEQFTKYTRLITYNVLEARYLSKPVKLGKLSVIATLPDSVNVALAVFGLCVGGAGAGRRYFAKAKSKA